MRETFGFTRWEWFKGGIEYRIRYARWKFWHLGSQGGTERVITRRLPDGKHYVAVRAFGRYRRLVF